MSTIQAYMEVMPRSFQANKATTLNLTYHVQINGAGGGTWGISIVQGQCKISVGPPSVADVVLMMNSDVYLKLAAGQLNVTAAYQAGQIKVNGQPQLALDLVQLFSPWASHVSLPPATPQPTQPTPQPSEPTQPTPQPSEPTPQPSEPTPQPTEPSPLPTQPTPPTLADYVQAMPFGFRANQARGMNVAYQFQLSGTGGGTWTVRVANGSAAVATGGGVANVVIGMTGADFMRLAHGNLNTTQAYQQGQLQISGDINLAANITTIFATWASQVGQTSATPQPTQPTTPQPSEPTPQPADPTPEPLPSTPTQPSPQPSQPTSTMSKYVMAMPNGFKSAEVRDFWAIYEFQISGEGGGTWSVLIANQKCTVSEGRIDDSPTIEIGLSGDNFIKLAQGQLNTKQAFQYEQLRIAGELDLALKLTKIFNPWAGTINSVPPLVSAPQPPTAPAQVSTSVGLVYPRLLNGSFDEYQTYSRDGQPSVWKEARFPERYGKYWTLQVIFEVDGQARLIDSGVFGKFTQKYFRGGGRDYHINGRHSQVITGRYGFDLVLYQTVAAQSGLNYTFSGSIVSFYKGTAGERADGKIFKTLGIDPSGGSDYSKSQVVWGGRDGKDNEWRYPSLKTTAKNDAITVFIRLENEERDVGQTELNIIHLDNFKLE